MKERSFIIQLNGAANRNHMVQCSYFNNVTGQYTWLDRQNKVKKGESLPSKNIKIIEFGKNDPIHRILIPTSHTDSRMKEVEALIEWWKNFPRVGRFLSNTKVDSFPSDNHKRYFINEYSSDPNSAIDPGTQDMVYIDEAEVAKDKNKDVSRTRKVLNAIADLTAEEGTLQNYAYFFGINPVGYEDFEIENLIYEYIENNKKHEKFLSMVERKEHHDPVKRACHIAIAHNIFKVSEKGMFMFRGDFISDNFEGLVHHFQTKTSDWNALRLDLEGIVRDLPANPNERPSVVDDVMAGKGKKKVSADKESENAFG
jgi:hypothetical protein